VWNTRRLDVDDRVLHVKILSVVGARPQFVKLAPVGRAIVAAGHEHVIVHTGQHYDHDMSDVFFHELRIPSPDVNLEIGSAGHGAQTGAMLAGLEVVFMAQEPDWVVVYGDTNSTIAAALAAVKLHLPVAHVEAGLRSFNRRMPEEHNRVLSDHAADLLLAPTAVAMGHLANEGLADRSRLVGDVMLDVFRLAERSAADVEVAELTGGLGADFVLATIHRPDNTDDPQRLRAILAALAASSRPVVLAVHPRLRAAAERHGLALDIGSIRPRPPLPYLDLVAVLGAARSVVTDSGGLQKEAFFAGSPCSTVRPETEWVETLEGGWNVLVDDPAELARVAEREAPPTERGSPYGDGDAGRAVVAALEDEGR
jgi:UDP-N-acetylglucosamine 2-epimerase (non-hydrolysing)